VKGICGCGLPARCCQPAVVGGIIYADLRGELSTHLALQALFTQCSPTCKPLLQAFPFPSTLEEVTLHPLSQACVFVYSSHGKCVFPSLLCSFLPPPLLQASPLLITGQCCCSCQLLCLFTAHVGSGSSLLSCGVFLPPSLSQAFPLLVAGHMPPSHWSLSSPPGLFIYSSGKDSLPPIFSDQCTPPSFLCVFIILISYYSVFLFSPGGGRFVQGAMLLWPRVVCGSTMVLLSSPCPHLPKPSGCGQLVA
jgi:hypothetical protein